MANLETTGVIDMQYLLLIYSDEKANAAHMDKLGEADRKAELGKWFAYTEELKKADVFVAGEALQPTATATTVRARNDDPITTDGPFAETKEQLGGFYMIDCKDLDEALKWAAKCPGTARGAIEVRPIMSFD